MTTRNPNSMRRRNHQSSSRRPALAQLAVLLLACCEFSLLTSSSSSSSSRTRVEAFALRRMTFKNKSFLQATVPNKHTSSAFPRPRTTRQTITQLTTTTRLFLLQDSTNSNNHELPPQTSSTDGSVLGAALLFAGTAIGAGMLALPAETAAAGYVPSLSCLVLCWAFTYITAMVTLEGSWTVSYSQQHEQEDEDETDDDSSSFGFVSMTKEALGPLGEAATALLFWFLLTSIVVAYTSEGGELVSEFVQEFTTTTTNNNNIITPQVGSAIFMTFFGSLALFGTERVDAVNRILVLGLLSAFVGLLGVGLPQVDVSYSLGRSYDDWGAIYPEVVSVGILSLGAQNVVPTLLQYLGGDAARTQRAVLVGSLIPLVMYCLWETVFLGIVVVPFDPSGNNNNEDAAAKMEVMTALGASGGTVVKELVEVFSACAIGSSMAGASISLVDFFQDAISTLDTDAPLSSTSSSDANSNRRLLAAGLALAPPLGVAGSYPDAFLGVLESAGLIGGVSLYGLLPALAVIQLRKSRDQAEGELMPGRLIGGFPALYALIALSIVLVVPDAVEIAKSWFK